MRLSEELGEEKNLGPPEPLFVSSSFFVEGEEGFETELLAAMLFATVSSWGELSTESTLEEFLGLTSRKSKCSVVSFLRVAMR